MVVYKITNKVNGKVYIGQTIRCLNARVKEHFRYAANDPSISEFYSDIVIYGPECFESELLAEASTQEELDNLEIFYISKYRKLGDVYNITLGGKDNPMNSAIVKSKHKCRMSSNEVRSKISKSMKAYIKDSGRTSEYVSNLRNGFKAYQLTEKYQHDLANKHLSPEHKRKLNDSKNKSVYCIDLEGNIINEFNRVKDAADWWFNNGYNTVKSSLLLCDRIKESFVKDKYIRNLKWVYRV